MICQFVIGHLWGIGLKGRMNFLDLFFPEQTQDIHLYELMKQGETQGRQISRQRFQSEQNRRVQESKAQDLEKRVEQLEHDLGQAGLVIAALLEMLEDAKLLDRQSFAIRVHEMDARDGVIDGRQTPPPAPPKQPFVPKRKWNGPREG
jgi:hypothetical protein